MCVSKGDIYLNHNPNALCSYIHVNLVIKRCYTFICVLFSGFCFAALSRFVSVFRMCLLRLALRFYLFADISLCYLIILIELG